MTIKTAASALTAAMFLLAGCNTVPHYRYEDVWANPAKSGQEFYRDRAECTAMANSEQRPNMAGSVFVAIENSSAYHERSEGIFSDCMMGRGWQIDRKWFCHPKTGTGPSGAPCIVKK